MRNPLLAERRRGAGGRDRERSRSPLGAGGYARGRRYEESSEYGSVDAGDVARRRLSSSKSFGVRGEAEQFDAAYYKTRIARLEEKVAKEHQKVKATVKYYEEQFEEQAKKILSVAVHNHYKRIDSRSSHDDVELQKSNILII